MIRVVVVDDHPVFRRGVRGVLEEHEDVSVVGEACDSAECLDVVRAAHPDVVLMDLDMPGGGGVATTRAVLQEAPATAVLVLTMSTDSQSVHAAVRAGARGYLVKGASGERIVAAVRAVAGGDSVFGGDIAAGLLGGILREQGLDRRGRFPALTDREEEVLDLVARGWSNAEITRRLVVSEKTVRNHVSNVFAKLGVPDRARAIVVAREAGLGDGPLPGR